MKENFKGGKMYFLASLEFSYKLEMLRVNGLFEKGFAFYCLQNC